MRNTENNDSFKVLIIGGGIAGMAASRELSKNDLPSVIIEKSPTLGGHGLEYCCKASESCNACSTCLVNKYMNEIEDDSNACYLVDSYVKDVNESDGKYSVRIIRNSRFVDAEKCIACGECSIACPAGDDVILLSNLQALPLAYHIDVLKCVRSNGEDCRECETVCPNDAINLDAKHEELSYEVGAIIAAIGFKPVDASLKYNYHLNKLKNVITGYEVEKMIRETGSIHKPSDHSVPKKIAFIQCVGSRDSEKGMDYCSRVCCMYSMRISRMLGNLIPDLDITFFYMDLQDFGKNFSDFYKECRKKMKFLRSMPSEINEDEQGRLILRYEDAVTSRIDEKSYDMIILSIGIQPAEDTEEIVGLLNITTDSNGFLNALDFTDNTKSVKDGIYIAGACQGPKDIIESASQGIAAASNVIEYLGSKIKI